MWPAFIDAARESLPGAEEKIAFDKCHVAKYLGEAVDRVHRQKHKASMAEGREDLKGSKYDRLYEKAHRMAEKHGNFRWLRESAVKTVRAWATKELAISLWAYASRTWARKTWKRRLSRAMRCRLERNIRRVFERHCPEGR
uniref:Transposase n=1 Tax=Candidatus Kentrum sp. TC TaxID=2126339 RepID=A0A450ZNG2_9GAMM|nr:MAG: transposase [Candidatus Kentron sp. TC]